MKSAFIVLALFLSVALQARELPVVKPESLGISGTRLRFINAFAEREIAQGRLAGVVTLVARRGRIVHFEATGKYGLDDGRPMDRDALFRIYSMSKPITTVAMMMLYEEGKFDLGDPVRNYLPEFAGQKILVDGVLRAPRTPMTIEQLMTHTAGLGYGLTDQEPLEAVYRQAKLNESRDLAEFVARVARLPLRYEPGTRYFYSVSIDVLGALVERLSGQTLEQFMQQRIFEPLGMHDTFFNVPDDKLSRLATNQVWDTKLNALAVVPAADNWPPPRQTLFSGGAGLFSTAHDYFVFCEMLRRGGSYEGVRILGPKTVRFMTIDHLTRAVRDNGAGEFPAYHLYPGYSVGLGFAVLTDPGQAQVITSQGEYSWGGAANTKFWVDPQEELVAILMTQAIASPWSDHTRSQMRTATYQALEQLNSP